MSFFNLFNKSPKEEPPKRPSQEEIFGSPILQANRVEAATEVMGIFDRHFTTSNGVHAGTVLSTAAWLAGTSLYRSFGYPQEHEPGMVILSEIANQEFPKLLNLFQFYIFQSGLPLQADQFILQIPDEHKPLKTILEIQEAHQDEYNAIMKRHGLDYLDGARAGMIVCSMVFSYHCLQRKDIDPRLGAGIISMGIVAGSKTAPFPLGTQKASPPNPVVENNSQNNQLFEMLKSIAINSTNGSGTRLVIGDGMIAMQDALINGGKYILIHPEVANQLQQKNIDPYTVYEIAMRIELESRIPRVDFVGKSLQELFQAWKGKPQNQAPIHLRQALWVGTNADKLGYEYKGNCWVLK